MKVRTGRIKGLLDAQDPTTVMRQAGLVEPVREGREVRYRLADPAVLDACDGMARVMRRRLARIADLSARIGPETERRDGAAAAGEGGGGIARPPPAADTIRRAKPATMSRRS